MARKLTKKQKALLDKQVETKDLFDVLEVDGLIEKLEKINDYETLIHDANRYLTDKSFDRKATASFTGW